MRTSTLFQGIVFTFFLLTTLNAEIFNLGEVSREEKLSSLPIEITSTDSALQSLATRAFETHGAYNIVPQDQGLFLFSYEKTSPNSVQLTISSGLPRKQLFQFATQAESWQNALLILSDIAVKKTSGNPGFFAGQIAFVGQKDPQSDDKEIFMGDLFFQNVKQLTHDASDSISPRWSPDGSKIFYTGYFQTGFPDVFMLDLSLGQRKTIAAFDGINTGATFSPKGDKTAMILSSSGTPELYLADKEGRRPHRLTNNKALEASPCFNQNGDTLFFTSDELGGPQIYKINLTNNQVARIPTNISRYCAEPAINPIDENILAFTAAVTGTFQITLFDFQENKSHFLTNDSGDFIEPCWTNDGRHLIATHRSDDEQILHIVDSQTGKSTPLHSTKFGKASMASFSY